MDQFLADYYGTADVGFESQEDELEKMAQLTLLTKEAAAEGIDLSELSDEELVGLAGELYGGAVEEEDLEKEAAAKFEEADFLGRVMAHSYYQELGNIEKAAAGEDLPGSKVTTGPGVMLEGESFSNVKQPKKPAPAASPTLRELGQRARKMPGRAAGWVGKKVSPRVLKEYLARRSGMSGSKYERMIKGVGAAAMGAGALGVGGAGYGGYRAMRSKKSADSAFEQLVIDRANEHLAAAGLVGQEKTAGDEFEQVVDRAALELLEANGYNVEWYDQ